MNTTSFTTRILWTSAALLTTAVAFFVAEDICSVLDRIRDWQSWAHLDKPDQWLQISMSILAVPVILSLPAGVWIRIIRRRNLIKSFSADSPYPFTPHGKYAVWNHVQRFTGRQAAFSGLRTRKRMRH